MRIALILILILGMTQLNAQLTFQKTDSISYALYKTNDWNALAQFGKKASFSGFDFYYLNLRVGIAYYRLGNFEKAEYWLQKALKNNASGDIAKEYLFWIYRQTGWNVEAEKLFSEFPENIQKRTEYSHRKLLDYAYLEGGGKSSSNSDTAGIFLYAHAGFKHQIAPWLDIYQGYTFMKQDLFWGDFQQHQYHFSPTFHLPKGWKIGVGGNYFDFQRNFEIKLDSTATSSTEFILDDTLLYVHFINTTVQSDLRGKFNVKVFYPHFHLSKSWYNFNLSLQYAWYGEQSEEDFSEISDTLKATSIFQNFEEVTSENTTSINEIQHNEERWYAQHQVGLATEYLWQFEPDKSLLIGLESHLILREDEDMKTAFIPYFNARFSKNISLSGYWMQKGNYPLSVSKGFLVFNNYDKYKHRLSATLQYEISPKTSIYSTLHWDKIEDSFSGGDYQTYGVLTGIKINF